MMRWPIAALVKELVKKSRSFSFRGAGVFGILLAAALAACAQPPAPETPPQSGGADGPSAAVAEQDPSPRFVGVIGTRAQHAPPFLGVPETNFYCLRSFVDRQTGETLHQLYVSDSYSGPERPWNAARDATGHPLRFLEISRHQITCDGGCSYVEEFAANIPESDLRTNPGGLRVTFSARSGEEKTIIVSGAQITAQLAAVEARRNPAPPAAALAAPAASRPSPAHQ
jgi:hypothetical protein